MDQLVGALLVGVPIVVGFWVLFRPVRVEGKRQVATRTTPPAVLQTRPTPRPAERRQPAAPAAPRRSEPSDPRWAQARLLLAELRADTDTAPTADAFEEALRTLFGRLERLDHSERLRHGMDDGGLAALSQQVEDRLAEVLRALADVHLHDVHRDAAADLASADRLLARVRADAEINAALATPEPPKTRTRGPLPDRAS